jgi:hypothetical protein
VNEILFIASAACLLAAMVALARSLPAQNVAFIVACLAAVEACVEYWTHAADLKSGVLFWPGAILLFRAAGQVPLKPLRQNKNYGLFLLCLASGAAAALQILFAPPIMAAGRFCLTAVCLLLLTPWFLQKRVTTSSASKG